MLTFLSIFQCQYALYSQHCPLMGDGRERQKNLQNRNCNFMQLPLMIVFTQNMIRIFLFQTPCIYVHIHTFWKRLNLIWNSVSHSKCPWSLTMNSNRKAIYIVLYTGQVHRWSTVVFLIFQDKICNINTANTGFSLHLHTKSFHIHLHVN